MVTSPAVTPVTVPAATVALLPLLLQLPPLTPSVRIMVEVSHTLVAPLMVPACGAGFTVIS